MVGSFHNGSFSRIDSSRKIPKLHLISWCRNVGNAEYLQSLHTRKLGEFTVFYAVIWVWVFKYHYCDDWNAYAFLVVKKKTGLKINLKKKNNGNILLNEENKNFVQEELTLQRPNIAVLVLFDIYWFYSQHDKHQQNLFSSLQTISRLTLNGPIPDKVKKLS